MSAIEEQRKQLEQEIYEHFDYHSDEAEIAYGWLDRQAAITEQDVAATLGSGTCENTAPDYLDFLCSACGFVHYHSDENDSGDGNDWSYCPNCGSRVVKGGAE